MTNCALSYNAKTLRNLPAPGGEALVLGVSIVVLLPVVSVPVVFLGEVLLPVDVVNASWMIFVGLENATLLVVVWPEVGSVISVVGSGAAEGLGVDKTSVLSVKLTSDIRCIDSTKTQAENTVKRSMVYPWRWICAEHEETVHST